jgi:hypothetical protein
MRIYRVCAVALSLAAALLGRAVAQDLRGGELRIHQTTANSYGPVSVAVAANGDFIAAWLSVTNVGGGAEIKARRFFADGRAKGGEVRVARLPQYRSYIQSPRVAADATGRFLVVWESPPATTNGVGHVFGQRFDEAGRALGPRLRFKASEFFQAQPDVAMTSDGRAVVVWESFTDRVDHGSRISDVYFRRLRANGTFAGPAVLAVSEGETSRVAVRADGSFALATEIYDGETYDLSFNLYAADGRALIDNPIEFTQRGFAPAIAAAGNGRMFVAWTGISADFGFPGGDNIDYFGVAGQLFEADGSPIGDNVEINTFKKGPQETASVVATPNGGFLVAWQSGANQDGDGNGIFARHFAADGRRLGNEIRMNLARQGNQVSPSLALAPNGHGIAAWSGPGSAGTDSGVFARRLAPPEP